MKTRITEYRDRKQKLIDKIVGFFREGFTTSEIATMTHQSEAAIVNVLESRGLIN